MRRVIEQGGLTLDGEKIDSVQHLVTVERLRQPEGILLRKGKKGYHILKL